VAVVGDVEVENKRSSGKLDRQYSGMVMAVVGESLVRYAGKWFVGGCGWSWRCRGGE
jgi:hypothetical protein